MSYNPTEETREWLDWAFERIAGLEYKPTARWLFYRLVQEKGFAKDDYKKFLQVTSKARKGYYGDWEPDTLADDTRAIINPYGQGFTNPFKWFDSQARKAPLLEIAWHQDRLVVVCFEAKAMVGQFKHLLGEERIPLCPFGGDASVPFKYQISELIDESGDFDREGNNKTIVILYFGDYDQKGMEIPENAMRDIASWCNNSFEYCDSHEDVEEGSVNFLRCGINREHIGKYKIPDRPDDPGKYQWEALDEVAAKEIVMEAVEEHWDFDMSTALRLAEQKCGRVWKAAVTDAIKKAKKELGDLDIDFPEIEGSEDEEA